MHQKQYYKGRSLEQVEAALESEGLEVTHEEDEPGTTYDPHSHGEIVLAVVEGSMKLLLGDATFNLKQGDRYTVPANAPHSAIVGRKGVIYVTGAK